MEYIRIRGARTHNLKNINLDLPRQRLIVLTGLSGSGKSSLAFDTLYAEGQRRYVESLSAGSTAVPAIDGETDVDLIEGRPAISRRRGYSTAPLHGRHGTEITTTCGCSTRASGDSLLPDHRSKLTA
jgi:excinuclease UvrABC ATPase subunit